MVGISLLPATSCCISRSCVGGAVWLTLGQTDCEGRLGDSFFLENRSELQGGVKEFCKLLSVVGSVVGRLGARHNVRFDLAGKQQQDPSGY